jgi:hypothetical protein
MRFSIIAPFLLYTFVSTLAMENNSIADEEHNIPIDLIDFEVFFE